MAVKSRVVLPYLIPQLTQPPINTKALSILASVAGEALNKYLHKILPALLTALSKTESAAEVKLIKLFTLLLLFDKKKFIRN